MSEYIGRRIVPVHGGVWDGGRDYEELTIVLYEASGDSYISRRPVPAGTVIGDKNYWMLYSLYSQQIANAVKEMQETDAAVRAELSAAESRMENRVTEAETLTNQNKSELSSRMDGIDERLDANVSASTDADADYAAEVVDARVNSKGETYDSLGTHLRAIGNGEGILEGAIDGRHLVYSKIPIELTWTPDIYIVRANGSIASFTTEGRIYFATEDYIYFPYAGCWILLCCAMSRSESDKSGIAFYDADKNFISGSDYNRETDDLAFCRLFCPYGTKYIRLTCRIEKNLEGVGFWLDDRAIPTGCLVNGAVTEEKLAKDCVTSQKLASHSVSAEKISDNAVCARHAEFMEIPLDIELTADCYIARTTGELRDYTEGTNTYFATVDYLPFPYGGSQCQIRASMSTASNDQSGLAFYNVDKKYISGIKYAQTVRGELCYTEFLCPPGTKYIRLTMYQEKLKDSVKLWFTDGTVSEGRIANETIGEEKLKNKSVSREKLTDDILSRLDLPYSGVLASGLPDNPLEYIRETPGYLSSFLHVGCIGDSLASGEAVYKKEDGSTGGRDLFEYSWGQYLARMTGNTYYNWSRGGLRCDTFLSSTMATECFDGTHKCEAYIIGLGQNERNKNYPIGTETDIHMEDYSQNPETYYGNYGKILMKIKEIQPKAKIFVLTDPLQEVEAAGYNEAVRKISEMFSNVYLVDLYTYGSTLFYSGWIAQQRRGGHYNAVGYYACAMIIATYIDWIIKKYPSEFREIEFIGTEDAYY
jgi:hypothetical protein